MEDKKFTLRDLKNFLNNATDEQLDAPVRWWGDERGGVVYGVDALEEDYGRFDEYFEPVSTYEGEDVEADIIIPKGTIMLCVD